MIELLRTKLFIPRPRKGQVLRSGLVDRLNSGLDKKLTLIAAPAGFGKTTLLSQWIPQSPRCVTWLALDEGDNDLAKFWLYFIGSLQGLRADLGEAAFSLLQTPHPLPITSILTTLINEITTFPDAFSVVLDDYHVIHSQPIHEALTFLIEHQPPNMNLILATRIDPLLPLARLRAHDQLTELRANDLRFSMDESTMFLNQIMDLNLSSEEVAALDARTEGWVAGLQIAALSMQGQGDVSALVRAFSGSHRHILGYLAEEVLIQQPTDRLDFLLQTSILDRMCGPLCDAVTGRLGGQDVLEALEQANLFIAPLDEEGIWYRYHHLFAEVLQARLLHTQQDQIFEFHRRASKWLEQNEWKPEAVKHAIAAGDFDQAASLIEQLLSEKWQTGEIQTLQGWLADLPITSWRAHPRLWLVNAWIAMTVGDFVQGDANLKAAEEAVSLLDEDNDLKLRPEILAFRASYASLVQDPSAVELAQQALQVLPTDHWVRGMLVIFLSAGYYAGGNLDSALDALKQIPTSDTAAKGLQPHRVHLLAFSGTIHQTKGKLHDALALLHKAVELAEPNGKPIPFVGTLLAYMSLGPVLYECDELAEAEMYLNRCLKMAASFGSAEVQVYVLSLLAYIYLARDNMSDALKYYDQVDVLLQEHSFSPSILAHVDYRRFLLYLKQGNVDAARAWVDTHTLDSGPLNAYAFHRLAKPQVLIASGSYDTAIHTLTTLVEEAQKTGHGSLLLKALALLALAHYHCGNHTEAQITLEQGLHIGEPEGFVRSFVDEGEPMRLLLLEYQSHIKNKISDGLDSESLRLLIYTDKLLAAFHHAVPSTKLKAESLPEPLSEREMDILRLIATGRSNQEIAEILFIALSTVKSHINNLYGKLGTNRRTEAVAIARDLGLLSF